MKKIKYLGILAAFIVIFSSYSTAQNIKTQVLDDDYGVELSCDECFKAILRGGIAEYCVQINNTGTEENSYKIFASFWDFIDCKIDGSYSHSYKPYIVEVDAGQTKTLKITVNPCFEDPECDGNHSVNVQAISTFDERIRDGLELHVLIGKKYNFYFSCDNPSARYIRDELTDYEVKIHNSGITKDCYKINMSSIEEIECRINGELANVNNSYEITVEPGRSVNFLVTAEVFNTHIGDGEQELIISAVSKNDIDVKNDFELIIYIPLSYKFPTMLFKELLNKFIEDFPILQRLLSI